jgi:N-acetylglucosaminyldiphosphoundecaprenol N-acetyl-beta-D-mannosaminyltransferase
MEEPTPQPVQSAHSVHWLLGLGFDCIGVEEARRRIFQAVALRTKLVFATPNVNFLAEANRDSNFRKSILATQLSLVDGMPLVWLGRLLGIPFTQRVAGSCLVERLRDGGPGPSLRVFFFGGEPNVAKKACEALALAKGPMIPAGWLDPGFVSVEEMSRPEIIQEINAAKPDMIIVSLGAKKGHFWIDRNRDLLEAPVISHLGAAVAFVSGDLRRAPAFFQRVGLEWLWRTAMEPRLATRYIRDAGFLASALVSSVAPMLLRRAFRGTISHAKLQLETLAEDAGSRTIGVSGWVHSSNLSKLSGYIAATPAGKRIILDLSRVRDIDSISVGHLYALRYRSGPVRVSFICDDDSKGGRLLAVYRAQCLTWGPEPLPLRIVSAPVPQAPLQKTLVEPTLKDPFQPVARNTAQG